MEGGSSGRARRGEIVTTNAGSVGYHAATVEWREPTPAEIADDWTEFTGGPPVVAVLGTFEPEDVEGLRLDGTGGQRAIVTWVVRGGRAEFVSVHVEPPGAGLGAAAIVRAEAAIHERYPHVGTFVVATTNDNAAALRFYQRRGFRLVRVELNQLDRVRALKPGLPTTGKDGLPLQDLWVLEKIAR